MMRNIVRWFPVLTEIETKVDVCLISLLVERYVMMIGINGRETTATVRLMIVKENILVVHTMILIEINLREIIPVILETVLTGLGINDHNQWMMTELILVTNNAPVPSISLKICGTDILQKLMKPTLVVIAQDAKILPNTKHQTVLKERLSAMDL